MTTKMVGISSDAGAICFGDLSVALMVAKKDWREKAIWLVNGWLLLIGTDDGLTIDSGWIMSKWRPMNQSALKTP